MAHFRLSLPTTAEAQQLSQTQRPPCDAFVCARVAPPSRLPTPRHSTTTHLDLHPTINIFFGVFHNGTHESVPTAIHAAFSHTGAFSIHGVAPATRLRLGTRSHNMRSSFHTSSSAIVGAHTDPIWNSKKALARTPTTFCSAAARSPAAHPLRRSSPLLHTIPVDQRHALRLAAPHAAPTLQHDSSTRDPHRDLELALYLARRCTTPTCLTSPPSPPRTTNGMRTGYRPHRLKHGPVVPHGAPFTAFCVCSVRHVASASFMASSRSKLVPRGGLSPSTRALPRISNTTQTTPDMLSTWGSGSPSPAPPRALPLSPALQHPPLEASSCRAP
ncbi:hypothetical protein B0H13DRAFT_2523687 [Mycena leptocephala]|nr:hypothetical protein B0H13DRAFT_2523687 [Mycena leptocephala]